MTIASTDAGSNDTPRRWLITGVSTGLGRSVMAAALARGDSVVGTIRDASKKAEIEALAPGRSFVVNLDVDDAARAVPAVEEAAALLGGLDVVVNNAGFGIYGPVELCGEEDYRRVLETNFFGLLRVTKAALPHLRASKGLLVNLSSIAGLYAHPGMSVYNVSKFAVEALSMSLSAELEAFGVRVMVVNPDAFASSFFSDRHENLRADDGGLYAGKPGGTIGAALDAFVGNEPGDPALFAQVVLQAVDSPNPPRNLLVGASGYDTARVKIERLEQDMAAWHSVASATARTG